MPQKLKLEDDRYPARLRTISRPPPFLWVEGEAAVLQTPALIAVVGSRKCTPYGEDVAFRIACDLARSGVGVVSGLAYGIDTAAHEGALAGGGKTIAVLGSGLDSTYPARNQELRARIESHGAVVTEFPEGTEANEKTFPQRNRIISGLSLGVVVVEAAAKSGALITADFAADQGREVYAVPGDVRSPSSAGTNRLIQTGARLVISAADILEDLKMGSQAVLPFDRREALPDGVSGDEKRVLELLDELQSRTAHFDELSERTGLPVTQLSAILTSLEISGWIRGLPGSRFERCLIRQDRQERKGM